MARTTLQSNDYVPASEYAGSVDYAQFRASGFKPIEQISEREWTDPSDAEKFMHQRVVIRIHTSSDPNAPAAVAVGVNGDQAWLKRDIPISVPRYFVERLAQSQKHSYKTVPNPDYEARDGMLTQRSVSQCVPFEVLHDPHPKGRQWLQRVAREGC
jgi:hypothetical protein